MYVHFCGSFGGLRSGDGHVAGFWWVHVFGMCSRSVAPMVQVRLAWLGLGYPGYSSVGHWEDWGGGVGEAGLVGTARGCVGFGIAANQLAGGDCTPLGGVGGVKSANLLGFLILSQNRVVGSNSMGFVSAQWDECSFSLYSFQPFCYDSVFGASGTT